MVYCWQDLFAAARKNERERHEKIPTKENAPLAIISFL
jgi:hypothetical protein